MLLNRSLQQPVGRGQPNVEDDIVNIKGLFEQLGLLPRPRDGIVPVFDAPLEDSLRRYQEDRFLTIDGRMKPGGETERNLQRDLGLLPQEPPFLLPELDITGPVANGREGEGADFKGVSKALGRLGLFEFDRTAEPLPFITKGLEDGIRTFQQREGLTIDGHILPGGETIGALKQAAAQIMAADSNTSPKGTTPRQKTPTAQSAQADGRNIEAERRALDQSLGSMKRKADDVRVSRARQTLRGRVAQFGDFDLPDAKTHLEHYLSGAGTPVRYDRDKARSFKPVRELESVIKKNFEQRTFQAIAENNPEVLKLLDLEDGKTTKVNDRFDVGTAMLKRAQKEPGSDLNSVMALGNTRIKSNGSFTAKRKGNLITITGTVTHDWQDRYDFNTDKTKTSGPGAADAKTLEDAGAAKQFDFGGTWRQKVEATVERQNGKLFTRDVKWIDLNE